MARGPERLTDLLLGLARDYPPVPLYASENGAPYADTLDGTGQVAGGSPAWRAV